jgi:hypothetical protein
MQILISYVFWHRSAILLESFRSKEYEPKSLSYVCIALIGMIKILKF